MIAERRPSAAKRLAAFHAQYPGVCVEVLVDNRAANLVRSEADIAIHLLRPDQPDLIARHVGEVVMGLYGSRDYLARHGEPTQLVHLKNHFLVGFDENMGTRNKPVQRLERCFGPENIVHRSSSFIGQLSATLAGIGVGAHDCVIADAEPTLQRVMPETFDHRIEIWLVTHADMRRSGRIRAVYDFLAAAIAADHGRLTGKVPQPNKAA